MSKIHLSYYDCFSNLTIAIRRFCQFEITANKISYLIKSFQFIIDLEIIFKL